MVMKQGDNLRVIGYVPRDAETKTTARDKKLVSFTVKASETEVDGKKDTQWQRCTVWGGSPFYAVASTIRKGDTVRAEGIIKNGSYTKLEGGEEVTIQTSDIWCDWVDVQHGRQDAPKAASAPQTHNTEDFYPSDEDLPF